ncbi:hypothetical protein B0J17DRAFT_764658 [Rhizoctonia solani]|nr:hypothetical protein B0J17DRAFT_764658 [Rhizoctonia solani]
MSKGDGGSKKPGGSQKPAVTMKGISTLYPARELDQGFPAPRQTSSSPLPWKPNPRGLNILCLDGGGVRGLSELVLILESMNRLRKGCDPPPKPADCFDIIVGSGTGGVIACMLGRLQMPIELAILKYGKLVQKGFSERKTIGSMEGAYVGSSLQKALKAMVKEATGNENEKMLEGSESECKTMVFAMSKRNMNAGIPVIFRSYSASANLGPDCTIWEALYASMAHPDLFDSIEIGDYPLRQSFVGAELGNSNPIAHALSEVRNIYLRRHVSCVLSIEDMARRFEGVPSVCFRLSVDQGMQNVDTDDWEKLDGVLAHTYAYLGKSDVSRSMSSVARAIEDREPMFAVAWIDGRIQATIKPPAIIKYCPTPTPVFTGRNNEIEEVRLCVVGGTAERRVCVIYGLGGAGKSQLAFKAIETNRDYWEFVIYVNASSKDAVEDTLRTFAVVRKIGHSHTSTLDWLGNLRKRWLLILDNIDDPSLCINDYFPHGNRGSILITTCLADLVVHARGPSPVISVSNMDPKEALTLLSKLVGSRGQILSETDVNAANALLEDFGHLALAIVHAGAYIGHHPHITIAEYRRLFLNECRRMLEQYSRLLVKIDSYEKTLLWLIAFLYPEGITAENFRRSSPSVRSYNPVVPLSELEHAADNYIKEYLCQFQNHEHWDAVVFSDVISELVSYSLINFDRTNLSYNIHILVQDWVRTVVLEHDATSGIWLERVATLLSRSVGSGDIDDEASLAFKRELGPHVSKTLLEHNGTVGVNHAKYFAEVFKARGQWDEEERLRIQIIESIETIPGHQDTMKQLDDLVIVYRNQGKWSEAEPLCSYLWETRKGTSDEHEFEIETIASAISLIEDLQKQSRLEQARELYQKVEKQYFNWLIDPYLVASNDLTLDPELVLDHRGNLASRLFEVAQELDHDQHTLVNTAIICESITRELTQANVRNQTHAMEPPNESEPNTLRAPFNLWQETSETSINRKPK